MIATALHKEPARRYASVEQFSDDIGRYLSGQPVRARRDTTLYVAGKFVRRHAAALAAVAVIVLLLASFAVVSTLQAARIARERDTAGLERTRAEQVTDFLVGLFASNDPTESRGEQLSARDLLDRGAARIRAELQDQPAVQATILETIARAYGNLGSYDAALALLDDAATRRSQLAGGLPHPDVACSSITFAFRSSYAARRSSAPSSSTRSVEGSAETSSASSNVTRTASPPRFTRLPARAWSTSTLRIARAARARKWTRSSHATSTPANRRYASCTRAVACSVCPMRSARRYPSANLRSSSYHQWQQRIDGTFVARTPALQQLRHLASIRRLHSHFASGSSHTSIGPPLP